MTVTITDDALAAALDECEDITTSVGLKIFRLKGHVGLGRARDCLFAATPPKVLVPDFAHRTNTKKRAKGRCEVCGRGRNEACGAVDARFQPVAWIPDNPLEIEHCLPRSAYHVLGLRNDVVESIPNLGYDHKTFNGIKGTASFTPTQIVGLWRRHNYGADDEHAPAVVLGSSVITAVTLESLRLPVLDDLIMPVDERPALGAMLKRSAPEVAAELEHIAKAVRGYRSDPMAIRQVELRAAQTHSRRVLRAAAKRMPA